MEVFMQLLEFLKKPETFCFALAYIAGYAIISYFIGKTELWKDRNKFEKGLISGALGLAIFLGMVVPYVSLTIPWLGFSDAQVLNISGVLIFMFGVILPLLFQSLGFNTIDVFKKFQILPIVLVIISWVEWVTVALFKTQVETLPLYLQRVMMPFWNDVFSISSTHLISVVSFNLLIVILFILRVNNELNPDSEKLIELDWTNFAPSIKGLFRKRNALILTIICILILLPSIFIQFDNSFHFVTPSLHVSDEGIPSELGGYYDDAFVLARLESGIDGESLEFYQVRYREYTVSVPDSSGLRNFLNIDSIFLVNPNNVSRSLDTGHPSSLPIWSHIDHLWLNVPENVTMTPQFNGNVLNGLLVDLENVSGSEFSFNMTYFKQIPAMDVKIEKIEVLGDYVNGTRQETYYFYITNNEDIALWIPYFELLRLYQNIEADSVQVLKDDELVTYAFYGTFIRPDMYIHPHTQGNLTISLTTLP